MFLRKKIIITWKNAFNNKDLRINAFISKSLAKSSQKDINMNNLQNWYLIYQEIALLGIKFEWINFVGIKFQLFQISPKKKILIFII